MGHIRCSGGEGWISMDNLHVQLVRGSCSCLPAGAFILKPGQEVMHGQTRDPYGGTILRHRPQPDQGVNFVKKPEGHGYEMVRDGDLVIIKELAGRDGKLGGCHWAL